MGSVIARLVPHRAPFPWVNVLRMITLHLEAET